MKYNKKGIIQASKTLDIVEIIEHETGSSLSWTVNKLLNLHEQEGCDIATKICKNNLQSCILLSFIL